MRADLRPVAENANAPFADQSQLVAARIERVCERMQFLLEGRDARAREHVPPRLWPGALLATEDELEARAAASATELPISWLRTRLGLTSDEQWVLWVLIAHEMSELARHLLRQLNTENAADPTTAAVRLVAFGERATAEASALLAPNSALVAGRLIERTDNDRFASEHRQTWKASRRVIALAFGDTSSDPELAELAVAVAPTDPIGIAGAGVETDPAAPERVAAAIAARAADGGTVIVQAPRGTGRRSLLRSVAAAHGLALLELDVEALARDPAQARNQLMALARDCRLFRRVPLLRNIDALHTMKPSAGAESTSPTVSAEHVAILRRELQGLLVLGTTSATIPPNLFPAPAIIELAPISFEQRTQLWHRALPQLAAVTIERLASVYPVAPAVLDAAATVARAQITSDESALGAVSLGLRAVLDGRMAGVATRIETTESWDELVLPAEQRDHLAEMIARIQNQGLVYGQWKLADGQNRGLGVSALFHGPPGTGKTMAAGLIAKALSANLYLVDTSKIVSKWLGETEKNLARLFDAAEEAHAVLLFDEADALFGKRTDVKSSNDRYANQETNYLLTRLESFRGIGILTTNHETAIDAAFKRRISFHVEFPMPELAERTELWRKMMRPTIPTQGPLNFAALARRYEVSGGYIRKAVMRAAFFAAAEGTPVSNAHLERAAHLEYQAMGRVVSTSL